MADEATEASEKSPAVSTGAAVSASGGHAVVIAQPRAASAELLPKVSRRGVVRIAFWSGIGAMLAAIGVSTINMLYPRGIKGFGGTVLAGSIDQLLPGRPVKNVEAKAWLVKLDADTARRNGGTEGAILALYQKCPHLGCSVPWRDDYSYEDTRNNESYKGWFLCPCHGSTYSMVGRRVFGPAPRSMDTMEVTIDDNGNLTVNTGAITQGDEDNGARGVLPS